MENKKVVVFGRKVPKCSGCVLVVNELEKASVVFEYKDITVGENYDEMCKLRVRGIPAVFVDGVFKKGADNIKETIKEVLA